MSRRKTIEDVAKLAGVSKVTVSYVLNGQASTARISAETEEKVLKAARELEYRPNALARMLLAKRTDTIAVVFQYATYFSTWSSFTSEVMRGVCEACVEQGLDLMLHTKAAADPNLEADTLMDGRVDGVLILRDQNDPTLEDVIRRKFPCVLFFTRSLDGEVAFVDSDNYTGGRLATQHLLDLGHRRIGMVRGSLRSVASNDRFNGYRDAMEASGSGVQDEHVCVMATPTDDHESFIRMMQGPDAPTALFVWSDDVAFAAMRLLSEWGHRVPEDVSVVGFDSLDSCDRFSPPLTSVRQPVCEMAKEATLLLAKIARGEEVARKQLLYPLTLDVRASTAPPKEGQPLR